MARRPVEAAAKAVPVFSSLREKGHNRLELVTQFLGKPDRHFGHIDLERFIEIRPEFERRTGELRVLIWTAHP